MIFFIRSAMSSYPNLMEETKRIGDPEQIGQALYSLPQDPRAKGMLRFNDTLLFYQSGSTAEIFLFSDIKTIKTTTKPRTHGDTTFWTDEILLETADGAKLTIETKGIKQKSDLFDKLEQKIKSNSR
ncbi:MAG: hypothetical protein IJK02_01825 [Clostridia bacterium]|nr:hypothetical protein [Clostridia bacterium]